jgi:hypothetical protein
MKKFVLSILLLLISGLTACGKTAEVPVNATDNFIPEEAFLIGFLDIQKLAASPQFANLMEAAWQRYGISFKKLNHFSFWACMDDGESDWAVVCDAEILKSTNAGFVPGKTIEGIQTLTSTSETDVTVYAVSIDTWAVIGTENGVAASIKASRSASFAESARGKKFRQMMAKAQGALTLTFVPSAAIQAKLLQQSEHEDADIAAFIKDFVGASLAADFVNNNLRLSLALESAKDAVKTAAESIMQKKKELEGILAFAAAYVGDQNTPLLESAYASFIAKADGSTLRLALDIPVKLIEFAVQQIPALQQQLELDMSEE